MPEILENVVVWKGRTSPQNRVIPDHLKLAILSRGRIRLPTANAEWLLDVVRADGQTWPDRLRRDLDEIFATVRVTIDLFQNQRPGMSMSDIEHTLEEYLIHYRRRHYPGCIVIWQALTHDHRQDLEQKLDIDLTKLFRRPRVRAHSRDPTRYVLLVYACIPQEVVQYIAPERPSAPQAPAQTMPPLFSRTDPGTSYNIRDGPGRSSNVLGELAGADVPVKVLDKEEIDGEIWYEIEPLRNLPVKSIRHVKLLSKGKQFWIIGWKKASPGILEKLVFNKGRSLERVGLEYIAAPWNLFRTHLREFEIQHAQLGLDDRITKLRQMSHSSDLPFDTVIGAKRGTVYLDSLPYDDNNWQMFKDYECVRAPDGRIIDIHHLFVGLDVLRRPEKPSYFLRTNIGTNWAAATWAGDLGAAVVDMERKESPEWEERNRKAPFSTRTDYYFTSRAGDHDLIADVDAWGIDALRSSNLATVDDLIASYYEHTIVEGQRTVTSARRDALERFLGHYGFRYDVQTDYPLYPVFPKQSNGVGRVKWEIRQFARIWKFRRTPMAKDLSPDQKILQAMTMKFLWWLEARAIENNVNMPK